MQLPSVQLDTIVESSETPAVANRNPEPGEVQVPSVGPVVFDYFEVLPLDVRINGELASTGTVLSAGWSGTIVSIVGGSRFTLFPNVPFESGSLVTVELFDPALLTSWSFVSYDVSAPLLNTVLAINATQIRVVFSEVVLMGALEIGDALNPDSYIIERVSKPAATPVVIAVDQVSDREVVLTTTFELSFGAAYMLVVSDVADEFGNVFSAPDNAVAFSAWLPPYPAGRRWLMHDLVPRFTLAEDLTGELLLFLGCLQDTNNILLHSIDAWSDILDPDLAPEVAIDAMLVDLGNPFSFELDLITKRRLVKTLIPMFRLKGTVPGIINAVRFFLGIEVSIETFTGRGWRIGRDQISAYNQIAPQPAIIGPGRHAIYCFRIHSPLVLTPVQKARVLTIGQYMKGAPEHLIGLRDAAPIVGLPLYWTVGITETGRAKLADGLAHEPDPSASKEITSFVLAAP